VHRLLCALCLGLLACNGTASSSDGGPGTSPPPINGGYAEYPQGGNPIGPIMSSMYVELFHFVSGPVPANCIEWAAMRDAGTRDAGALSGSVDYALLIQMCTDGGPIAPGTYPINNTAAYCTTGMGWAAVIQSGDATSGATLESNNAGTVTVTSVGTTIAGAYSASLNALGGDASVNGTFDVPICTGL
jgi:hypothetical protein